MLVGETNVKKASGDVTAIDASSITVDVADVLTVKGVDVLDDLVEKSVEITETTNGVDPDFIGQFRLISGYEVLSTDPTKIKLFVNVDWDIAPADLATVTKYAVTNESPNFFAIEEEQADWLVLDDTDSVAAFSGVLTDSTIDGYEMNISGLGMGPDTLIGTRTLPGGITYGQLEYVEINLGKGGNAFDVLATAKRDDYRTWTVLRTNDGNDIVNVDLNAADEVLFSGTGASFTDDSLTDTAKNFGAIDALAGKVVRILSGTGADQSRQIESSTANKLTLARDWETNPDGTSQYEILDLADGRFAVDTGAGADTVHGGASSLPLVMFGGDGGDTLEGGSAADIIFGDIGRVDYTSEVGELVTRLGDAPQPVDNGDYIPYVGTVRPYLGKVVSATTTSLTRVATADAFETGNGGLTGARVYINAGTGRGQYRIVASNDANKLTLTEEWNVVPDATSQYILFGIGENQTDGVLRDPTLVYSIDPATGGADTVRGNDGDDLIFGGAAGDTLLDGGAGSDTIVGDNGRFDFAADPSVTEVPVHGTVALTTRDLLQTTHTGTGGVDTIVGGAQDDIVFGGFAGDDIDGGAGNDILLGDNGRIDYDASVFDGSPAILDIRTTDTSNATGGADTIDGETGDDIVLGGVNGSSDTLTGGADDDILLGDNGALIYDDAADPDLATLDVIVSFLDSLGGADTVSGNGGSDVVIGGFGGDMLYGDDATGSSAVLDLGDYLLGDNARIELSGNVIANLRTIDDSEATGGADTIRGNAGEDIILAGVNNGGRDNVSGDTGNDIVLGDNGEVLYDNASDPSLSTLDVVRTSPFASDGTTVLGGGDDLSGNAGSDTMLGGTGADRIDGDDATASAGTDDLADLILGDQAEILLTANIIDHVTTTTRTTTAAGDGDILVGHHGDDIIAGGSGSDFIDGGDALDALLDGPDNDDLIFGDQVELALRAAGVITDPRFAVLSGQLIYSRAELPASLQGIANLPNGDTSGAALVLRDGNGDVIAHDYRNADGSVPLWAEWQIVDLDHSAAIETAQQAGGGNRFGNDYIAGGSGNDMIFGQLGNDTIQGDGAIESAIAATAAPVAAQRNQNGTIQLSPTLPAVPNRELTLTASYERADNGDDYIEGNGGNDVIFGNLGQDDIIGGSSDPVHARIHLRCVPTAATSSSAARAPHRSRPRRSPTSTRRHASSCDDVHARDADTIVGDNGSIYRLVGINGTDGAGVDTRPTATSS